MNGALRRAAQPLAVHFRPTAAPRPQQVRAFAAGPGEEVKVNAWQAPTEISKWKEEHIVFAVLGGWAIVIYGSMKIFGGKKKEAAAPAPAPDLAH